MKNPTFKIAAAAMMVAGAFATQTYAAGFQLSEQSAIQMGRAMAGAGVVGDDLSAVHYNPAGMTLLSGTRMQATGTWVAVNLDYEGDSGQSENGRLKGQIIPAGKRIMLTFGGGSVKRNGVYDQVVAALEGRDLVEFWGIEANPSVETLREAIALGKERKVDFLLAVGGGSVIDGTKLIAAGLLYDGDPWDIVLKGQADKTVPLGTVLTMSATGSDRLPVRKSTG